VQACKSGLTVQRCFIGDGEFVHIADRPKHQYNGESIISSNEDLPFPVWAEFQFDGNATASTIQSH
jgi:hypothetical protein